MLVDPSLDDLLTKVDNKFKLVTLALKRARDINNGELEIPNAAAPVSKALKEIDEGKVFVKDTKEASALNFTGTEDNKETISFADEDETLELLDIADTEETAENSALNLLSDEE